MPGWIFSLPLAYTGIRSAQGLTLLPPPGGIPDQMPPPLPLVGPTVPDGQPLPLRQNTGVGRIARLRLYGNTLVAQGSMADTDVSAMWAARLADRTAYLAPIMVNTRQAAPMVYDHWRVLGATVGLYQAWPGQNTDQPAYPCWITHSD